MSTLFTALRLRDLEIRNRIFVSPMCQYSSVDGLANDWHLVHLGSRAVGGAGLVMAEATAVTPEGRISPDDLGIWSEAHGKALAPIARFIKAHGAVPGIQLAHAGRKASTAAPFKGGKAVPIEAGGWETEAPSAVAFGSYPTPRAMTTADIEGVVERFVEAAGRALAAGFEVIELHAAHGYLLHQFLSPLSNQRQDEYGGSFENRTRLTLKVARALRAAWPASLPVFVRLSATDWVEGGWTLPDSVLLSKALAGSGIDLIDCSSGGLSPDARIHATPGYQVPFAETIRRDARIPTAAVGLITSPEQAEQIVSTGQADAVLLARQMLRDPYWPVRAARALGEEPWLPPQYERARRT